MRLAELNTEFFRKKFDLLLSEEQLSKYSEEERRLLYIDFRLEQRKVELGYCLQKLADVAAVKETACITALTVGTYAPAKNICHIGRNCCHSSSLQLESCSKSTRKIM